MTGTVNAKPPKNNAEWARKTEKRLDAAENSTALRAGNWTLATDPDTGNLIAGNVNGGAVILADEPAPSDNPDEISRAGSSFVKVQRTTDQTVPQGTTSLMQWDSLSYQTDDWSFIAPGTDLVIPADGIYTIKYHCAFRDNSAWINKAVLLIDGTVKMAQENYPANGYYPGFYLVEDFPLNAGQVISGAVYQNGTGSFHVGVSGADTSVYSSLSIFRLPVGG
jgi:hypothetical protein